MNTNTITLDTTKRNALYNALKKTLSTQAPDFGVTQFLDSVVHVKATPKKSGFEPNPDADNVLDYFGFNLPEKNTPIKDGEKNHTPMLVKTNDGGIFLVDDKLQLIMNHSKANPHSPQTKWKLEKDSIAKRSIPCPDNFENWYEWNCAFFELASCTGDCDPKYYLFPLYKNSFVKPPKMWELKDIKPTTKLVKATPTPKGPKKPSRFSVVKRWISHNYDGVTNDELEKVKTLLKGVVDTKDIFDILNDLEYEPDDELSQAIDMLDSKKDTKATKKVKEPVVSNDTDEDNSEKEDEPEPPKTTSPKTFDPDESDGDEEEDEDEEEEEDDELDPPKPKSRKLPWKK